MSPITTAPAPRPPRDLTKLPTGRCCVDCWFFDRRCRADFEVDPASTSCEMIPSTFTPKLPGKAAD